MKHEISSIDLIALLPELKVLEGSRIDKIYQKGSEIIINVYKKGDKKYSLLLGPGKVFLTQYKRDFPEIPPNFCMFLRKYLLGSFISKIRQKGFDRILEIHVNSYVLICELFGAGNFILVNNEKILAALHPKKWKNRSIFRGEIYKAPPTALDPRIINLNSFLKIRDFDKTIVSALSTLFGIGGHYAEEILFRVGIDKNTSCQKLNSEQLNLILQKIEEVLSELKKEPKPQIIYEKNFPLMAVPIDFYKFSGYEKKYFQSFSQALDEYYTGLEKKDYEEKNQEPVKNRWNELQRIKKQQKELLSKLSENYDLFREKADSIYKNYSLVELICNTLSSAIQSYNKKELLERLKKDKEKGNPEADAVLSINFEERKVVLDLGLETEIDFTKSVEKNAEYYYTLSKQAKKKISGLVKALEETQKKIASFENEQQQLSYEKNNSSGSTPFSSIYGSRKKLWYESFRWFYSSEGFLILGGRDAVTNEILIKKHAEKEDIVMHADLPGAPFVLIKTLGKNVGKSTLNEAAVFGVSYSSAWGKGLGNCDIYYVHPEQVVKVPGLDKGAFQIQGKRTYFFGVALELAVGLLEKNSLYYIMGGPISAVKSHCSYYVIIKQGPAKKSEIAKKIKFFFENVASVKLDLDEIIRTLPPGNCQITFISNQI